MTNDKCCLEQIVMLMISGFLNLRDELKGEEKLRIKNIGISEDENHITKYKYTIDDDEVVALLYKASKEKTGAATDRYYMDVFTDDLYETYYFDYVCCHTKIYKVGGSSHPCLDFVYDRLTKYALLTQYDHNVRHYVCGIKFENDNDTNIITESGMFLNNRTNKVPTLHICDCDVVTIVLMALNAELIKNSKISVTDIDIIASIDNGLVSFVHTDNQKRVDNYSATILKHDDTTRVINVNSHLDRVLTGLICRETNPFRCSAQSKDKLIEIKCTNSELKDAFTVKIGGLQFDLKCSYIRDKIGDIRELTIEAN